MLGWAAYDAGLRRRAGRRGQALDATTTCRANVLKASEDKTFPGAIVASLASPWGQSVPAGQTSNGEPPYFGSYREVFARDLYEVVHRAAGRRRPRHRAGGTSVPVRRQQLPNGSMPRNSLLNGEAAPDTGGLQLDETAYPILMAWQAGLGG